MSQVVVEFRLDLETGTDRRGHMTIGLVDAGPRESHAIVPNGAVRLAGAAPQFLVEITITAAA